MFVALNHCPTCWPVGDTDRTLTPLQFSIFGLRAAGVSRDREADGVVLTKAAFIEKVRRSNEACQCGDFPTAVRLYSDALRADPQNCILYSNRSAARLKLGQYQTALDDALKARLLNPTWPKVKPPQKELDSPCLIGWLCSHDQLSLLGLLHQFVLLKCLKHLLGLAEI